MPKEFFQGLAVHAALVRTETLEGRECLVFPVIMMVPGVHEGYNSVGPTLFKAEELAALPDAWNAKPVVMGHPIENGKPLSACSKSVLENSKVGILLNAKASEDGKLCAEAYVDKEKAATIAPRLLNALLSGHVTEVSIGCYYNLMQESGEFNGEAYTAVASDIVPDHLAILLDDVGACSVADGAGIPRLFSRVGKKVTRVFNQLSVNVQRTFDEISRALMDAAVQLGVDEYPYLEAVYDDRVIYWLNGDNYVSYPYTLLDSGEVRVQNTPQKVRRVVSYEDVTGTTAKTVTVMGEKPMKTLQELLAERGISPEAIEKLTGISEEDSNKMRAALEALKPEGGTETEDKPETEDQPPAGGTEEPPAADAIPAEEAEELRTIRTEQRAECSRVIMAHSRNSFTQEQLDGFSLKTLRQLRDLSAPADYRLAGASTAKPAVTEREPLALRTSAAKK